MKKLKRLLGVSFICLTLSVPAIANAASGYSHEIAANYNIAHARIDSRGDHGLVTEAYVAGSGTRKDSGYSWAQSTLGNRGRSAYAKLGSNYRYQYSRYYYY